MADSITTRNGRRARVIILLQLNNDNQRHDLRSHTAIFPAMKITEPYSPSAAREGHRNAGQHAPGYQHAEGSRGRNV